MRRVISSSCRQSRVMVGTSSRLSRPSMRNCLCRFAGVRPSLVTRSFPDVAHWRQVVVKKARSTSTSIWRVEPGGVMASQYDLLTKLRQHPYALASSQTQLRTPWSKPCWVTWVPVPSKPPPVVAVRSDTWQISTFTRTKHCSWPSCLKARCSLWTTAVLSRARRHSSSSASMAMCSTRWSRRYLMHRWACIARWVRPLPRQLHLRIAACSQAPTRTMNAVTVLVRAIPEVGSPHLTIDLQVGDLIGAPSVSISTTTVLLWARSAASLCMETVLQTRWSSSAMQRSMWPP